MKILFNALGFDGGRSGISQYMLEVLRELSLDDGYEVTVITEEKNAALIDFDGIRVVSASKIANKAIFSMCYSLFIMPFIALFGKFDGIILPAGNRRVLSFYPRPTAITFHDYSQAHIPNKYDGFRMFYVRYIIPFFLRFNKSVFCISKSTLKDVHEFLDLPVSKLKLNYNGFRAKESSGMEVESERRGFLYVARLEHPGKNHVRLLEGYAILPLEVRKKHPLFLAGGDWGGERILKEKARELGVLADVHFLGFVSDEELSRLYQTAKLFTFPSLYEGFGFPILEAMSLGLPVICSNVASLPEVGGKGAVYFDPTSPGDIADKISSVLFCENKQQELISEGKKRVEFFQWEDHVSAIIEELKSA